MITNPFQKIIMTLKDFSDIFNQELEQISLVYSPYISNRTILSFAFLNYSSCRIS